MREEVGVKTPGREKKKSTELEIARQCLHYKAQSKPNNSHSTVLFCFADKNSCGAHSPLEQLA